MLHIRRWPAKEHYRLSKDKDKKRLYLMTVVQCWRLITLSFSEQFNWINVNTIIKTYHPIIINNIDNRFILLSSLNSAQYNITAVLKIKIQLRFLVLIVIKFPSKFVESSGFEISTKIGSIIMSFVTFVLTNPVTKVRWIIGYVWVLMNLK